jgi:cell division protein FtsB
MRASGGLLATVGVALLLLALGLVTWRQARSLEALAGLDELRGRISIMTAERNELENNIRRLESRGHIVQEARDRLGMYAPGSAEIVLLPGRGDADRDAR